MLRKIMRPIKVVYMIDAFVTSHAGTESQLIKMINGLDSSLFSVQLVCLRNHPWLSENASALRCNSTVIDIHEFKKPKTFFNVLKLIRLLRKWQPDVVHTFFPVSNIVGAIAARIAGVHNVISSRRDYGEWMNGRYLLATRIANKFVTRIVANGHRVKELTVAVEKEREEKITVIYNGIDLSKFSKPTTCDDLKARLGIPHENKIVGKVANFRPMKHHYTFIKAANEILKMRSDVDFLLIGTDESGCHLQKSVEESARSLGILSKIHFTGRQKDVVPYLSIMDVGVNCSEGEGLSNAIIEYMASGVPCVASNSGGNPDLIKDGETGRLFELDDYKQLAGIVQEMLDSEQVCVKYITSAKKLVHEEMSVGTMLSKYESFYRELVATSSR